MPVKIVDRFEPVEIDHGQQAALAAIELRLDIVNEGQSAPQSSKAIGLGLVLGTATRFDKFEISPFHPRQRGVRIVLRLEQAQLNPVAVLREEQADRSKDNDRGRSRRVG